MYVSDAVDNDMCINFGLASEDSDSDASVTARCRLNAAQATTPVSD